GHRRAADIGQSEPALDRGVVGPQQLSRRQRYPEVVPQEVRAAETGRRHTYYREWNVIQPDTPSHDPRIAAEAVFPQIVADDGHSQRRASDVFLVEESAPALHAHA